jgi:hypothetical protein
VDINEKINQANLRLKTAQVGVSIVRLGNRLYLQATLPPKPDSHRTRRHQQRISLHSYANPAGVQQAEKEARKIGALVACREFDWSPYLKEQEPEPEQVREWVEKFKIDYFIRRPTSPKTQTTWKTDYEEVYQKLPRTEPLTSKLMIEAIASTKPDTRTRKRYCIALGALAKFAGIDFDAKPYKGRYSPRRASPRDLPGDRSVFLQNS